MKWTPKSTCIPSSVSTESWFNWKWQAKNSLKSAKDYAKMLNLTDEEAAAFSKTASLFKTQTTPYYASLIDSSEKNDPIRRMIVPSLEEVAPQSQSQLDPLGERKHSPAERVVHRYPDRVLFLLTDLCGIYCRYCTRKHFTGKDQAFVGSVAYQKALNYIRNNKAIREVILSGGDPLTLSDARLEQTLQDLTQIEHIELVRIGTRMPVVNPMRITEELVMTLKKYHPIYMMVHFNHPKELTAESAMALSQLVDNGFPVMNQMVLLNGINNHAAIVQALSRRLLQLRVKPYYMFQVDPSEGSDHLRTTVENSQSIQAELWGRVSGLMMPNLSLDIPDGGGKAGFVPDFVIDQNQHRFKFKGWDGVEAEYVNPPISQIQQPADVDDYIEEWNVIKNAKYGVEPKQVVEQIEKSFWL